MDVLSELDDDRLGGLLREDRFFWLDLTDPGPEALEALGERFGLHPAAVEDSREWGPAA
jgi:magnesium transporter